MMGGQTKWFAGNAGVYIGRPTWGELNKALEGIGRVTGLDGDPWREMEALDTTGWIGVVQMPTTARDREGVWMVRVRLSDADVTGLVCEGIKARLARQAFDVASALKGIEMARGGER